MVEPGGFDCDIAHTAGQAKSLLGAQHYAAMTLDLGLPDQNGLALIREQKPFDQVALRHALERALKDEESVGARILHVEDDADIVSVVSTLVGSVAQVVSAATREEAQRLIHEQLFGPNRKFRAATRTCLRAYLNRYSCC